MRSGALAVALLAAAGCRTGASESPARSADARCENDDVPTAPAILVVVAHPDDDVTGFAGVIYDAVQRGSRIRVVFVTDGQANCSACARWRGDGEPCTRKELDALGRVRRREAIAGLGVLGVRSEDVAFLAGDDGTLGEAWARPDLAPRLPTCGDDAPTTDRVAKTGRELRAQLRTIVSSDAWAAVFTTHPLDGHPDHAAVAHFVAATLGDIDHAPPHFAAVLHTRGQHDCAWPAPAHPDPSCPSADAPPQPTTLRYRPHDWLEPPTDASYGEPILYCVADRLLQKGDPLERRAIEAHVSQMGDVAAAMLAFVRRNEVLYRLELGTRARVNPR